MKASSLVAASLFAALWLSNASAQQPMGDMKSMGTSPPTTNAEATTSHHATGVVKRVDRNMGLVTPSHEPVKSLNWPAMTMGFLVQRPELFDRLAVGAKVEFDFVQGQKGYVVTAVK